MFSIAPPSLTHTHTHTHTHTCSVHLAFGRIATEDEAVSSFLARLGLSIYAPAFESHDVDLDTIEMLTHEDLQDIGRGILA